MTTYINNFTCLIINASLIVGIASMSIFSDILIIPFFIILLFYVLSFILNLISNDTVWKTILYNPHIYLILFLFRIGKVKVDVNNLPIAVQRIIKLKKIKKITKYKKWKMW